MTEVRLSPEQFNTLCVALIELKAKGYSPEECSMKAFKRAGLKRPLTSVDIVVDPELKR